MLEDNGFGVNRRGDNRLDGDVPQPALRGSRRWTWIVLGAVGSALGLWIYFAMGDWGIYDRVYAVILRTVATGLVAAGPIAYLHTTSYGQTVSQRKGAQRKKK